MSADFDRWRSKQTIWMRAATSRPWEIGAKLLTPMHKLQERAMCCFLADLFSNRIDPNDPPRWFEVLTLGLIQRRRTSMGASRSSLAAHGSTPLLQAPKAPAARAAISPDARSLPARRGLS
ncbi:MAG: hypothetical protein ACPHN2_08810 [Sinimarinibacterium flocculans]|uniref:hypothetical protein n=1 Tax=Sinimarinibacterium flocculans TaxID=985250 RepID=UPI003C5132E2